MKTILLTLRTPAMRENNTFSASGPTLASRPPSNTPNLKEMYTFRWSKINATNLWRAFSSKRCRSLIPNTRFRPLEIQISEFQFLGEPVSHKTLKPQNISQTTPTENEYCSLTQHNRQKSRYRLALKATGPSLKKAVSNNQSSNEMCVLWHRKRNRQGYIILEKNVFPHLCGRTETKGTDVVVLMIFGKGGNWGISCRDIVFEGRGWWWRRRIIGGVFY